MSTCQRLIATAFAASFALATLSACNTVEGVGKDLKSAGKSIENAAEGAKDKK